jgi:hypothetical protein
MNRPYVGIIAVGLLALAAGLSLYDSTNSGLASALLRVGLVMGALWLAFPQLARPVNWWIVVPVLVGGYAFFRLPPILKVGLVVVSPILLAICWPQIRNLRSRFVK